MHNTLAYIEFAHRNPDEVWKALSATAAEGFLAHDKTRCLALIFRDERVLYALSRKRSVAGSYQVTLLDDVRNTDFNGLTRVPVQKEPFEKAHVTMDSVTPHGKLIGWAHAPGSPPVTVLVNIDGTLADTIYPDMFRKDLLHANVGIGCGGFSRRLPDQYLDGHSHEITLELHRRDDPDKKTIARMSRREQLPFHFNLPRPWIASGVVHAVGWTARNEEEYLDIRQNILEGDFETGLTRAAGFITDYPSAIFKDFGVRDRYRIEDLKFVDFGRKVRHRWGQLFGDELCEKGVACCKTMKLAYNATPTGPAGTQKPLLSDSWERGGLLDSCPLKIRHFASKELTQSYATHYGFKTPAFFCAIRTIQDFDAFDFPHQYVLKPDFESGVELYLMHGDLNLFDGFRYSKDIIRNNVAKYLSAHPNSHFLVEEFLCQDVAQKDQPIIPLDYKIHCFGNRARFVQIVDKNAVSRERLHSKFMWLSRDWAHSPYSIREITEHPNAPVNKPYQYEKMVEIADHIATDLGDYIRVDMYATPDGPVLGELSSFANAGTGFTAYGERILSQCWEVFDAAPT